MLPRTMPSTRPRHPSKTKDETAAFALDSFLHLYGHSMRMHTCTTSRLDDCRYALTIDYDGMHGGTSDVHYYGMLGVPVRPCHSLSASTIY